MATQAQFDACRANAKKSRGPVTPEGRLKSAMNALKHGRRSKRLALLRDESLAFETRRGKWMAIANPKNDMEEYLVVRTVALSFELDRSERAHLERLNSTIDDSDDTELEEIYALAKRLFADPAGHASLYGITPENRSKLEKTSGNGVVPDPNDPGVLVRKLESSEMGCTLLRSVWEELRSQLDETAGKFWQSLDRLKAIRLLGKQPVQANEDRRIAEIFVASHALNPAGRKSEFEDLHSDMTPTQHDRYRRRVWQRWPDLKIAEQPAKAREILIDLCDENIEELDEKLAEHEENAGATVERNVIRDSSDQSREGNNVRTYAQKCSNAYFRSVETLRKYQGKKRTDQEGREDWREPQKIVEQAGLTAAGPRRRIDDTGLLGADTAWATAGCQLSVVSGPLQMRNVAGAVDQAPSAGGGSAPTGEEETRVSRQGENSENVTNDPNFDEHMIVEKTQEDVGVTANSGAKEGLDNLDPKSVVSGELPFGDSSCQLSVVSGPLQVRNVASAVDQAPSAGGDGTAPTGGEETRVSWQGENSENVTNDPNLNEHRIAEKTQEIVGVTANSGAGKGLDNLDPTASPKPQGSEGGRRIPVSERLRRERTMRELKRRFEEKLKAGDTPLDELILDVVASTAKVAGIALPSFPRPP